MKITQEIDFFWQLDKLNDNSNTTDAGAGQNMFVLTVLEKTRLKFPQGNVAVLKKMVNYEEAIVKLTNTQLKILISAAKMRLKQQ